MSEKLKIGIDIDGLIGYAPHFFRNLCVNLINVSEIHVITARVLENDKDFDAIYKETADELKEYDIPYTKLALVPFGTKCKYIKDNNINILFENTDEEIKLIDSSCVCFKIREDMNYCWKSNRWIHSDETSVHIKDLLH